MAAPMRTGAKAQHVRKLSFPDVLNDITRDTDDDDVDDELDATDSDSWKPSESDAAASDTDDTIIYDTDNITATEKPIQPSCHDHDTNTYDEDEQGDVTDMKRGRRRKRDPSSWKRNMKARKRLRGEEYVGEKGKIYGAVKEGQPCNCRKHCFVNVDACSRALIRKNFYDLPDLTAQRLFLGNCIKCTKPQRRYAGPNSKRKVTFEYSVHVRSENVPVCKQGLASILGISIARINYVCDAIKVHGTPGEDKRGKHGSRPNKLPQESRQYVIDFLDRLPRYRSHYTRRHNPNRHYLSPSLNQRKLHELYVEKCATDAKEPVSFRMFEEIFATERCYHFGQPSLDTCKTCDRIEMALRADPENPDCKTERELHLRKAEAAQVSMKNDFALAKNTDTTWTIALDFQQTLPTPHINTSVTFYSRQLWTYNLGIHDRADATMHMWSEDIAGRGSSEVLSSVYTYLKRQNILADHLIAWSDSCGGQNKNKNVISFWYYIVHVKKMFKTVEHKFPVPGHTFLPCDRDFGVIERKKRRTAAVYNPDGWYSLVENSKTKRPLRVVRMTQKDNFININPMKEKLCFRTKANDGTKVKMQKAMRIKIEIDNIGKMFIAYTHNPEESWQEINISRRGITGSFELPTLYSARRAITHAKLKDLRTLCSFIPEEYRPFYLGLQATVPSPRTLRTGVLQERDAENSQDESDVEVPSDDSESDCD